MKSKPQPRFLSPLVRGILIISVSFFATKATPTGQVQSKNIKPLSAYPNCGLRINELFGNLVDGVQPWEFIELKALCANGEVNLNEAGLYGHKLVLLSSKTVEGKSGVILGTVSLQNSKLSPQGFFTIGGRDVIEKSMSWADNSVSIRNPSTRIISSFFQKTKITNDDKTMPYAVALLRIRKKSDQVDQKEIQLGPNKSEKPLTPQLERIIQEQLIDLVVYNSHSQINSCDLFSRIAPEYPSNSKYVLRSYVREVEKPTTVTSSETGSVSGSSGQHQAVASSSSSSSCSLQPSGSGSSRSRRGIGNTDKKATKGNKPQQTIDSMFRNQGQQGTPPLNPNTGRESSQSSSGGQSSSSVVQQNTIAGTGTVQQQNMITGTGGVQRSAVQQNIVTGTGAVQSSRSTSSSQQSTPVGHSSSSNQNIPQTQQPAREKVIIKYSISRCTDLMKAYFPESFKITPPTPNQDNDCECGVFIMQAYAPELFGEISQGQDIEGSQGREELLEGGCRLSPGIAGVDDSDSISEGEEIAPGASTKYMNTILSYMHDHDEYFVSSLSLKDQVATTQEEMEKLDALLKSGESSSSSTTGNVVGSSRPNSVPDSNTAEQDQLRTKDYNDMIRLVRQHQSDIVPVDFLESNRAKDPLKLIDWLEYLPNVHKPKEATFRCRICREGVKDPIIGKHPTKLAGANGVLYSSKKEFRDNVGRHIKKELHREVLARQEQKKLARMEKAVDHQQKTAFNKLSKEQQSTARMLTTIFAEAKMYLAFSSHPKLMNLFKKLELHSLGFHHHLDDRSAARMLSFISEEYHRLFLTYLTSQDRPMAILLDTGVDKQGNDFLSVIIQTLEKDKPKEFFFKMIPLGVDVTATGYINALKNAMDEDMVKYSVPDLWEYMRKNLVAVISDGANTFSGNNNGFGVLLSEKLFGTGQKNKLFRVHCSAHRLQLAGRHLVDKTPELQVFENQLRSISTFYNQQHSKNLAHITALSQVLKIPLKRISYIFPPRWCVNAELVLSRMMNNMPLLMNDLPAIAADNDFADKTQAEAGGLANFISNINFHAMMYLVADITNNLNFYSAEFQKAGSLLIGKGHYRQNFVNFIDGLKMAYGTHSKKFLSQLTCQKNIHTQFTPVLSGKETGMAWDKVDKSLRCKWSFDKSKDPLDIQRVQLVGAQTRGQAIVEQAAPGNFNQLRIQILDKLQEELNKYFPENDLYQAFDKLHPSYFRETEIRQRIYGADEIEQLAERFSLPVDATRTEFTDLMFQIVNSGKFEEYSQLSPKILWPKLLRSSDITFGPNIRKLIRITLVIAPSSASVERSYSILNHVKSPRRGRLNAKRLEDLIRVATNGDDNLDFFPAEKLALKWTGHQTGKLPYKRRNVVSVSSQANIPSKMALSNLNEELAAEDEEQAALEAQESAMDEFEIGIDQEGSSGAVFSLSEELENQEESDLGGADIFRTFVA